MPTNDTSGPLFTASSPSATLQYCLESKLRERLDLNGSLLFALTWRVMDTPSGPPICQLAPSARRTSGKGFGSWPTPTKDEAGGKPEQFLARKAKLNGKCGVSLTALNLVAQTASWPTPTKGNADGSQMGKDASATGMRPDGSKATVSLNQVASLAHGQTSFGSPAQTERRGQLNPAFSRWLMGYPPVWDACAPTATRSCRRSPPSS